VNLDFLESELAEVRRVIDETLRTGKGAGSADISAAVGALFRAGGKFLRPRILLLSAMTGKYDPERIRPLAAAVELLHTATLIHDDVIDDSPSRRGLPAVHTRVGRKDAVLAGDWLFSRCFLLAAERSGPENARNLARAIDIIVGAEMSQDAGRWRFTPSVRDCVRKIGGKTATLFAMAARAGAAESKAPLRTVSALSRAAWAAGVAFQIQDDILDWTGTEAQTGKTVRNDLAEGFCTLPLALALRESPDKLSPLLTPDAIRAGSDSEIAKIVAETGAIERATERARLYRDRSLGDLSRVPASFARDELARVFASFTDRTK